MNKKPIGMLLKQADQAITSYTDNALRKVELTRLHWQILRSIHEESGILVKTLKISLQLFADDKTFTATLNQMVRASWVEVGESNNLKLSEKGAQKHDEAFEIQSKVRERCINGIDEKEYTLTMYVLEQIINNLK